MFMNMGTAIGLCAALGILLGALLQNVAMWLCIGAGAGTVLERYWQLKQLKADSLSVYITKSSLFLLTAIERSQVILVIERHE